MYISDINTLRNYEIVNNDFDFQALTAKETIALNNYFLSWMSQSLISQIYSFDSEAVGSVKRLAYEYFMGALCRFSIFEFISTGEITIGSGGITRNENENTKSAYAGQVKKHQRNLEDNAYKEINALVDLMNANTSVFTEWPASPGSLINSTLLIKSSNEFNNAQRLHRPAITFMHMVPDMRIQQDFFLTPAIPSSLLSELILNTSLSPAKKTVREDLVRALSQLTVARCIETGLVKLSSDGVQMFEDSKDTGFLIQKTADAAFVSAEIRKFEDTGKRYIDKALKYIKDYPTEFTGIVIEDPTTTQTEHTFRI